MNVDVIYTCIISCILQLVVYILDLILFYVNSYVARSPLVCLGLVVSEAMFGPMFKLSVLYLV